MPVATLVTVPGGRRNRDRPILDPARETVVRRPVKVCNLAVVPFCPGKESNLFQDRYYGIFVQVRRLLMNVSTDHANVFVTCGEAAKILGVKPYHVCRMASAGMIGLRTLPVREKYLRTDVERLARESVQPATR